MNTLGVRRQVWAGTGFFTLWCHLNWNMETANVVQANSDTQDVEVRSVVQNVLSAKEAHARVTVDQ